MDSAYELMFETTIRSFLGDKANHIAGQVHSEKHRKEWYKKAIKVVIKKIHTIDTNTHHKEQLALWSERALNKLNNRYYNESEFTLCLLRLVGALLGLT